MTDPADPTRGEPVFRPTNRTPQGRALGWALRQERTARNISLRAFADRMGRDCGVMSRWETGDRAPAPEHVVRYLTLLGVPLSAYSEIMSLAHCVGESRWIATTSPQQRRQLATVAETERTATRIITVHPLLIPDLLRSLDYFHATLTGADATDREAIQVQRQQIMTQRKPVQVTAVIGEAALRTAVGAPEIMAEQCRYLLKMGRLPQVDLRVVPFSGGVRPSSTGPFTLIEADPAIVYLELHRSTMVLHQPSDLTVYREAASSEQRTALSLTDSTKMIMRYLRNWEEGMVRTPPPGSSENRRQAE